MRFLPGLARALVALVAGLAALPGAAAAGSQVASGSDDGYETDVAYWVQDGRPPAAPKSEN